MRSIERHQSVQITVKIFSGGLTIVGAELFLYIGILELVQQEIE